MEDIASLGFSIDSSQAGVAVDNLDGLTEAAGKAEKATDRYGDSTKRADKAVQALNPALKMAVAAFTAIGAAVSIRSIANMADTWSDLSARVGLAIRDMDGAAPVMDRLANVARQTYSALELTSESFIRNSTTLREMGKSTEESLNYVEALNLALVVAGARGDRARMIQENLSKAMAAGVLRGEELNTVIQSGGRVAEALAEELGTTVSGLRSLGEQGQITGDIVYSALTSRLETLREEAEAMPATIGDAFTLIYNSVLRLVGTFDQWSGASATVATALIAVSDAINWLVDNIGTVVDVLAPVAPLMAAVFGPIVLGYVMSLAMAISGALYSAVASLWLLLAANPLGAVIAAVVILLGYFVDWRKSINALIEGWGLFMYHWNMFWGDEAGARRSIEIAINAREAVAELGATAQQLKESLTVSFDAGGGNAGQKIASAMSSGGDAAASKIGNAVASGAQQAQAIYENLNGKVVKPLGDTLVEGGNYIHNQVTGAVTSVGDSMAAGGESAGQNIGRHMAQAGQQSAASFKAAGIELSGWLVNYFVDRLSYIMTVQLRIANAQADLARAQAEKAYAEARAIRTGNSGGSSFGSGGGRSSTFSGTSFVGAAPQLPTSISVWDGSPTRTTVSDESEGATTSTTSAVPHGKGAVNVKAVTVFDPALAVAAMNTAPGEEAFINFVTARRDEIAQILGVN